MNHYRARLAVFLILVLLVGIIPACGTDLPDAEQKTSPATPPVPPAPSTIEGSEAEGSTTPEAISPGPDPQGTISQVGTPPTTPGDEVLCSDSQPPFITDFEVRQTPNLPEPAPRTAFRDPVFGTCLVRVTDRTADLPPDDPSTGL